MEFESFKTEEERMDIYEDLYDKLVRLQWLLHRRQLRGWAERGPMADTTRGQGRILALLKLRDGISTKDLSYLLEVRVSSLNELLAKMEKGGYVTREPSEEDKRVMLVKLTEKGRKEQQAEPFDFADIFSCLSGEELGAFGEYLERIIDALDASVGDDEEDILSRLESLRSRFGEKGAFFDGFDGHGHDSRNRRGFMHGLRMEIAKELFGQDGFEQDRFTGHHGRRSHYDHDMDDDE